MKQVKLEKKDISRLFTSETPLTRVISKVRWAIGQAIYLGLLFLIFFVLINGAAFWQRLRYQAQAKPVVVVTPAPQPAPIPQSQPVPDYSPEIQIPKIGTSAPIIMNVAPAEIINQLKSGVVQYDQSALPGQIGNVVLVGHSSDFPWSNGHYKTIFSLLDKLAAGDNIVIPFHNQIFTYQVSEKKVVKPTDLSVLKKTDDPNLTLITCYPVGTTTNRLIIRAKLVGGTPTGSQTTEPATTDLPKVR
jgi:LPXTG-site transpeptidase (sortase) family protein